MRLPSTDPIAASVDRSPSDLSANGTRQAGTNPGMPIGPGHGVGPAHLDRDNSLRDQVSRLGAGWSPEQVNWPSSSPATIISHESIDGAYEGLLLETLPASSQVETRLARSQGPASSSLNRPLVERPQEAVTDRLLAEADLMLFHTYGQAVLTLHEPPSHHRPPTARQGRRSDRQRHRRGPRSPPAAAAADDHLRQRDRVRTPSSAP